MKRIASCEQRTACSRVSNPNTRCSANFTTLASARRRVRSTTIASELPAPSIAVKSSSFAVSTRISPAAVTTVIRTTRCPSSPSRREK